MNLAAPQTQTPSTYETFEINSPSNNLHLDTASAKVKDIWLVDSHVKNAVTLWSMGCFSIILCSLGTAGNIINVLVFYKMGFKEAMNISFMGLAVADIGCLITQIWLGVQHIPQFRDLANWLLPFDPADPVFRNATAAWPHICFLRITGLLTAHATLVRCLCIAMPLRVKTMLTPGRTLVVIVSIFLSMFAGFSPVCFGNPLGWKFTSRLNRTIIMQLGVNNVLEQVTFGLSAVTGYVSFFVVILCTCILITNLRRKAKWREGVTGTAPAKDGETFSENKSGTSGGVSKEIKIIKLVLIISAVFIGSYFPSTVAFLAATTMPDFSPTGKYQNLFFVVLSFTYNLEAINSSVNIFIYLNMSSKYKVTFDTMFNRANSLADI